MPWLQKGCFHKRGITPNRPLLQGAISSHDLLVSFAKKYMIVSGIKLTKYLLAIGPRLVKNKAETLFKNDNELKVFRVKRGV